MNCMVLPYLHPPSIYWHWPLEDPKPFKNENGFASGKYMLLTKHLNHQGKLMENIIGDSWEINCSNLAFFNNARLLPM